MRSFTSSFSGSVDFSGLGSSRSRDDFSPPCPVSGISFDSHSRVLRVCFNLKVSAESFVGKHGFCLQRRNFQVDAMDEGSVGFSSLDDWGNGDGAIEYVFSSSEGEDSDGDIMPQSITDVDLPTTKDHFHPTDDFITVTTHRFAMLGRVQQKRKTIYGVLNNIGLMIFLTVLLFLVDCCAWRIVRLPLEPFYLIRPFFISTAVVSSVGYVSVPLLRSLRLQSIVKQGLVGHPNKKQTPTMGGLYFIPVGIVIAEALVGFSSIEVTGASAVTLAFAAIGLLDDLLSLKNNTSGLSVWMKILLEVAVTTGFSFWLCTTDISSPYSMKTLVPLPGPLGLVCLGRFYPILTSFCIISMANGVDSTDGLDGLAGGIAALAFVGMSIAVLPICSDLAVFGVSMAGACVGFLFHNRYKASVFMGDTGSLALGGALAAMAACTGMFFPLFISSGVFVLEALSTILPAYFFKTIKNLRGAGSRWFQIAPFHHHLQLFGIKEPFIVAGAYAISSLLILCAGYVGLVSV